MVADGLRLRWWQLLRVPELSLAGIAGVLLEGQGEHRPGRGTRAPSALAPCPHCHQQRRAGSLWHPGICLGLLWRAGGRVVGGLFLFLCFPARAVAEQGGCWQLHGGYCSGLRGSWDAESCPAPPSRPQVPGGFLQLHPFHGSREHFLADLHAFSRRCPSSCQFISIYLPSSGSHTLSGFLSNAFIHCWAQDKMNSHWGQASRGCCRKHPLLSPLLP